jgi:hypothetical protein
VHAFQRRAEGDHVDVPAETAERAEYTVMPVASM